MVLRSCMCTIEHEVLCVLVGNVYLMLCLGVCIKSTNVNLTRAACKLHLTFHFQGPNGTSKLLFNIWVKRPPRTIRDHPLKLIHLFIYRQLENICSLGNLLVNDKIIDIFNPTVGSSCMKYFYVDIFVFKYVDDAPCGMTHAIKCRCQPSK